MEATVLNKQSLLDIAIQHTGSVFNAFDIAVANGLSVSATLEPGTVLILPKAQSNSDILNYFSAKRIKPATALSDSQQSESNKGIGWMKVADTFKVD